MWQKPEQYGIVDFKIPIPAALLDRLEQQYVPRDHPVFELTPPIFHERASAFYEAIGSPVITRDTFWRSYRQLLQCFVDAGQVTNPDEPLENVLIGHFGRIDRVDKEEVALLEGMKELRQGGNVVGDQHDVGYDSDPEYAALTSDSDSDESVHN